MLRKPFLIVFISMLLTGLLVNQSNLKVAHAATFMSINFVDGGEVNFTFRGTVDDYNGRDYVMVVWYNSDGLIVDTDRERNKVGNVDADTAKCNDKFGPNTKPCTFEIYDITSNLDPNDANELSTILASPRLYPFPPDQLAPQAGMISISQGQPVYDSAGGNVVRDGGGNELWLPQDYDGSGADTHLVMSSTTVDGRTWYEIWIGDGGSTVWIPADSVTVVE